MDRHAQVEALIRERGEASARELVEALGYSLDAVRYSLRQLKKLAGFRPPMPTNKPKTSATGQHLQTKAANEQAPPSLLAADLATIQPCALILATRPRISPRSSPVRT